jgi:hypothetical protein
LKRDGYAPQSATFADAPPPERFVLTKLTEPKPAVSASATPEVPTVAPARPARVARQVPRKAPTAPAKSSKPAATSAPSAAKKRATANDAPILE